MSERWKPVEADPRYAVSDLGRVRGPRGKILKPVLAGAGYLTVQIGAGNRQYIHRLVAHAFLGPCHVGMEVLHRDDVKPHCAADNLEYGTHARNMAQANMPRGTAHWNYKHGDYIGIS